MTIFFFIFYCCYSYKTIFYISLVQLNNKTQFYIVCLIITRIRVYLYINRGTFPAYTEKIFSSCLIISFIHIGFNLTSHLECNPFCSNHALRINLKSPTLAITTTLLKTIMYPKH